MQREMNALTLFPMLTFSFPAWFQARDKIYTFIDPGNDRVFPATPVGDHDPWILPDPSMDHGMGGAKLACNALVPCQTSLFIRPGIVYGRSENPDHTQHCIGSSLFSLLGHSHVTVKACHTFRLAISTIGSPCETMSKIKEGSENH
jgi:hypothetical protein